MLLRFWPWSGTALGAGGTIQRWVPLSRNWPYLKISISINIIVLLGAAPASSFATEICGALQQGQYAEEQLCANVALTPDGLPAANLDSVPADLPWLFPAKAGSADAVLTLKINAPDQPFQTLQVINGWASDGDATAGNALFDAYARPREVGIETSDGRTSTFTLEDSPLMQFLQLGSSAEAKWVKLTVRSLYPGKKDIVALRWVAVAWEAEL